MHTFDEFDEQTDLSFLNVSIPEVEVSKKQAKSKRTPLSINGNSISVYIIADGIGEWNRGRKHTQEHRAKLSAVNTGRKLTGKALENVLAGHKKRNTKHSEATKAKISKANKGRPGNGGNSKSVMTPKGQFASATLAAEFYGWTRKVMTSTIRRTDSKGAGFYYVKDGVKQINDLKKKVGRKSKSIMTPAGVFESAKQAAEFFGFAPLEATRWTRMYPQQFYYIKD